MIMALRLAAHRGVAGGPCPSHQALLAQACEPRSGVPAGAHLPAHGGGRGDGRGAAPGRVSARTSKSGPTARRRCSPPTASCSSRLSTSRCISGRCRPRWRAAIDAFGDDARPRRSGRRSTIPSPAAPTSTTSPWSPRASSTGAWSAGPPTGPTTPTWAAWRRAPSLLRPPRSTRRVCASRPCSSRPKWRRSWRANSRTPASAPVTSMPSGAPTVGVERLAALAGAPLDEIVAYGERRMRAALADLPDGAGRSRTSSTPPVPGPSSSVRSGVDPHADD